jgi:hypothetical protein
VVNQKAFLKLAILAGIAGITIGAITLFISISNMAKP